MTTTIWFLLQEGQERADVTSARLSLKKQQGPCKSLWWPGQVTQRCAPATLPAWSSTKPIKGLKTYQDLQSLCIFGSDQLERDSLKVFGAWGTRKPHPEVQRTRLGDSNYLRVKDINLKLVGFKIFHYSSCTPFAMKSFQSDGLKFRQVMLEWDRGSTCCVLWA